MTDFENTAGAPFPFGVSWIADEEAWNFALYSKHAERVTLVLYSETDWTSTETYFVFFSG